MLRRLALVAAFLLLFTGLGTQLSSDVEAGQVAVVQGDVVNLRGGPGTSHSGMGQVFQGARLPVVGKSGDWVQVRRADGQAVWIAGWLVQIEGEAAPTDFRCDLEVQVNNHKVDFPDQKPFIDPASQRTYVPLRFVSEALGADVDWDGAKKVTMVKKDGRVIRMPIGTNVAQVNGVDTSLDAPAMLVGGRTMVPLRFVSEVLDASVDWVEPDAQRPGKVLITTASSGGSTPETGQVAVVQGSLVNLRGGPGWNSPGVPAHPVVGQVRQGERLPIVGKSGDWVQVRRSDGSAAWIASELVRHEEIPQPQPEPQSQPEPQPQPEPEVPTPESPAPPDEPTAAPPDEPALPDSSEPPADNKMTGVAVVQVAAVDVRSHPGNHHAAIAQVTRGFKLPLVAQQGDWYQVMLPSGKLGWVESSLVEVDLEADASYPSRGGDRDREEPEVQPGIFKVEASGDRVIITAESPEPMTYAVFRLPAPDRIVIDIDGFTEEQFSNHHLTASAVEQLRTGIVDGRFRVVCDLKQGLSKTRYKTELSGDRRLLTVEVYTVDTALKERVIMLDPGHGGEWPDGDPGAVGPTGLQEDDVVLAVALEAARLLRQEGGQVILTRTGDQFVELDRRAELANEAGAEVFVSIHADAHVSSSKHGTSTHYWLSPDVLVPGQMAARKKLARVLQDALVHELGRHDRGLFENRFVVLRRTNMASALVEIAFISNHQEEQLLADSAFQKQAAAAIVEGLREYFKHY
jgi:N-acetylmuramoyl-L-alanine amidase